MTSWNRKDLIGLRELSRGEIELFLDTATAFKKALEEPGKSLPSLSQKTVVNLFVEPSTRTRTSFELAARRLQASVVSMDSDSSSFRKGETLKDTAMNLQAMDVDMIIMRHSAAGAPGFLADRLKASVINAGDGAHEHPTQGLLDIFTMREHFGKLDGLKVAICGDILYSRVARSNIWALTKCGAEVTLVGPRTLLPDVFRDLGVKISHRIDDVLEQAQVIMLLRIQHERQRQVMFPSLGEYISLYGLTKNRISRCRPDVLVMHPGPINRGIEVDSDVADGPHSVILEQVTNGLLIRMAALYLLSGGKIPMGGQL